MNQLPIQKRAQIINLLVEGSSLRATSRIADVSINTVSKLLFDVGQACIKFHNEAVTGVTSKLVQVDEIWSFVYSKEKNGAEGIEGREGDVWTWTGIDADSKFVLGWLVADRSAESAHVFIHDLASRLANRVQLTSDGHRAYLTAVESTFKGAFDFSQLVKIYGGADGLSNQEHKYNPEDYTGLKKTSIAGSPDKKNISTSFVERQNLTMRLHMRRFHRLTNAFSKKIECHNYAIALHFVYYNYCKILERFSVTPAMEAGLTKELMEIKDIVLLTEKYKPYL